MRAHGHDQFAAAGSRPDAFGQHFVDDADRHALQQRHTLAQCRLELDLAAHRALGDFSDMVLQPREIRELVDAFLADHGGIHVGQKQLLAPGGDRLHNDIDRQVAARRAQAIGDGADVVLASCRAIEGDVGRNLVPKPVRGACRRQHRARAVEDGGIERGVGRVADEGGDEGHR